MSPKVESGFTFFTRLSKLSLNAMDTNSAGFENAIVEILQGILFFLLEAIRPSQTPLCDFFPGPEQSLPHFSFARLSSLFEVGSVGTSRNQSK